MLSELKDILQPSERQFVLVDNTLESKLPLQYSERIPILIWIDYKGKGGLKNPPSVTFLVNPATLTTALTKKINTTFTRGGYVVETWGDNLDVLNFSGTIGAYYVLSNSTAGTGLNRYDRSKSYSFRNLMEIFLIYRNNGAVFSELQKNEKNEEYVNESKLIENAGTKTIDNLNAMKTTKTRIKSVGDVYLQYDRTLYMGSFDSFSIEEDATKPFTLNYSFSFTVLRKNVSDNRTENYYNQVALDFEDRLMSRRGNVDVKAAIQKALETTKNSKDQEALTNPKSFDTNLNKANMPSVALARASKILASQGYAMNSNQSASYYNTFKEMQGTQTYAEAQRTKQAVENITASVVKGNASKTEEEKTSDTRTLSDSINDMATSLAKQVKD